MKMIISAINNNSGQTEKVTICYNVNEINKIVNAFGSELSEGNKTEIVNLYNRQSTIIERADYNFSIYKML